MTSYKRQVGKFYQNYKCLCFLTQPFFSGKLFYWYVITVLTWVCISLLTIVLFETEKEQQNINFHQQEIYSINYGIHKMQLSYLKKNKILSIFWNETTPVLLLSDKSTYVVKEYLLLKKRKKFRIYSCFNIHQEALEGYLWNKH